MIAVDLFAGLGGFSEGARLAGVEVAWAANHWRAAVDVHASNHPETAHLCQDLHQADWSRVPRHDLLLASPSCTGHTRARGRERPGHDAARSTAWAVVSCAEVHRPPIVVVENVTDLRRWALYPAWCSAMSALGYTLAEHVVDAADHSVPQHRTRLFVVASRSRAPLELRLPRRPHTPIASVIDWTQPTRPIGRPGRATATLERIRRGREEHGDRFVAPFYGSGSGTTGRSIGRPIGTITTRDRWLLVDGDRCRMFTVDEYLAAMGFRRDYAVPRRPRALGIHLLGNAVCPPVVADLLAAVQAVA